LNRPGLVLLAFAVVLIAATPATRAYSSESLNLRVYSDGYVDVTQVLSVDSKSTTVQIPLLASIVSGLVATDQDGSPLSYSFGQGGTNITVYTLGATGVTVSYATASLTMKNGTVWTLSFTSGDNATVTLPQASTLSFVSGTPYWINETNSAPELGISPGTWEIYYGVALGGGTQTTPSAGFLGGLGALQLAEAAALVAAIVLGGTAVIWRRRGIGAKAGDLRADDLKVLNFIQEKGGRVLEPEIRMKFALPKTSAWRQIKRLERLGYIRVTKIGSQNQIELTKDRGS
jgi:uncharacterized membrane protein